MYGNVEAKVDFPATPEEWATKRWYHFTVRVNPSMPWMKDSTRRLIDNFETVVACRWPTVQDIQAPNWSRRLLKLLSSWRYALQLYAFPLELHLAHQFIRSANLKSRAYERLCAAKAASCRRGLSTVGARVRLCAESVVLPGGAPSRSSSPINNTVRCSRFGMRYGPMAHADFRFNRAP